MKVQIREQLFTVIQYMNVDTRKFFKQSLFEQNTMVLIVVGQNNILNYVVLLLHPFQIPQE